MAKVKDLTTGSPIKLMLLYALPVLAGNICQQIYNFADTIIVGQKLGENALAAVGTTGSMYFSCKRFRYRNNERFCSSRITAFWSKGL